MLIVTVICFVVSVWIQIYFNNQETLFRGLESILYCTDDSMFFSIVLRLFSILYSKLYIREPSFLVRFLLSSTKKANWNSIFIFLKGRKENRQQHTKDGIEYHLELMNYTSQENNRKNKEMEDELSRLQNDNNALQQQLRNQTQELVAARNNIQTQGTKISMIEQSMSDQRRDLEKLYLDLEAAGRGANGNVMSSQMEEILKTVRQHETRVNNLHKELVLLKGTTTMPKDSEPRPNLATSHHACERRLDRTEHQLALHEIQLSDQDLKVQILQTMSYDGVYLWKIDQYSRRFQEAVSGKTSSIYSPPFYVGRFGYKVCACLYPNGDGMGKETHVSVFFVIMRGEYDALLPWSFTQKVHFKLLDQDRIRDAYDCLRPDPQSSSFKRPTSDMNIASGCPTFISHRELRQGGYVQGDTIFVKIIVDILSLRGDKYFDNDSEQHLRKNLPAITHPDNQI